MKKRVVSSFLLLMIALASSAKVYIPLVKSVPPSTGNGGDARVGERTSSHAPMAYYEVDTLYIEFPIQTATSVIITDDLTDTVVLNESFSNESTRLTVPIHSIPLNKQYNLSVNAYGVWWVGYFEYLPSAQKIPFQKYFQALADNPYSERNYGIFSVVGNATSGWNFGVSGILSGQNMGTGIYGSSGYDEGIYTGGRYAGLFHGDLKATDAVYASAYNTLADSRLNINSRQLGEGTLEKLTQMSVFKYDLKQFDIDNGYVNSSLGYYNDDSGILEREHFGLSGQELIEIYPNLVTENQDGYLSINYVEMVPLLIQSIQELKAELDALKSATKVQERLSGQGAVLYQNAPNPFNDRCIIRCIIPKEIKSASLYLFDYNGHQIQSRAITERGDVQLVFEGAGLDAGIYLYSLITDGRIVDTRRMLHIME